VKMNQRTLKSDNMGLSNREYFAALAMQALLSSNDRGNSIKTIVEVSVASADALIKELEDER